MANQKAMSLPVIHVISDSMGITARTLTRAATSQFGDHNPKIDLMPNVEDFEAARRFLDRELAAHKEENADEKFLLFYTLVEGETKEKVKAYVEQHSDIVAVDLIGNAVNAISQVTGSAPQYGPGGTHTTDAHYFKRIAALEFSIAHDDGQRPQDLTQADIVIVGVSRTSKTPTSIYLGQQGYRVANVPLVAGIRPPAELFKVERSRIFGLMTSPEVLSGIRRTRMGELVGSSTRYSNIDIVRDELVHARNLMRELGCIIINTENRAIEETAQAIMSRYDSLYPRDANF